MTIHLGRPLPDASRDLPGQRREDPPAAETARRPYLVLLPVGFALPPLLPRGAVRSYRTLSPLPWSIGRNHNDQGGLLSVALSLGSPPPGVTRHRVSVEPGLSSLHMHEERPSGRLAGYIYDNCRQK